MVRCKFISASQETFLSRVGMAGIELYDLYQPDLLTVIASMRAGDYKYFQELAGEHNVSVELLRADGFLYRIKKVFARPVLLFGLILWALMVVSVPLRIFFIFVDGNEHISDKEIIEAAENSGVRFGALRKELRSEQVKNELLSQISQLQWVGLNTYGCIAEISVKEKNIPIDTQSESGINSIIAATDGIVNRIVVEKGSALCSIGDAVIKGQTLISGFTDCGFVTRAEYARGEVYAYTTRKLTGLSLRKYMIRSESVGECKKTYLKIGKNIINLSRSSGISGVSCAKIYKEKSLHLPGGFQLPITMIQEIEIAYSVTEGDCALISNEIPGVFRDYLQSQMMNGTILDHSYTLNKTESVLRLDGVYFCEEMIGRAREERMPIWKNK